MSHPFGSTQAASEASDGPVWHRFVGDQYGEHEDGVGYDGSGIGRGWPLLAGERAHYEVAAGNLERACELRRVMIAQANDALLMPEQVWDVGDIAERRLFNGGPTGSAMPLVWAHSEFLRLCRSIADRRVFDMPRQPVERYRG
jgi:glucoamylase